MSQPSFVWSMIFFYCRKAFFSSPRFLHFCKVKRIKPLCAKLVFFRFFPIFVSWFCQRTKGLSWQHQVQTHATHHLQSDPSWTSLQANHLNSSNHCIWKRRFWKLVCTTQKSYEDKRVQLFNNEVLRSRSLRERPTKFPMSIVFELSSKVTTEFAYSGTFRGLQYERYCWIDVISELLKCM